MAILLALVQIMTHRMALFIPLTIIPTIILTKFLIYDKESKFYFITRNLKYLFVFGIMILLAFIFSPIYPFKDRLEYFTSGLLFNGNNILIIILNLIVDYISKLGPILLFISLIGFILFIANTNFKVKKNVFIVVFFLTSLLIIINPVYTALYYLIIFALFFGYGINYIVYFFQKSHNTKTILVILSIVIITLFGFSIFKLQFPKTSSYSGEIFDTPILGTTQYINNLKGNIITDSHQNARRIMSITQKNVFPLTMSDWLVSGYGNKFINDIYFHPELDFETSYFWLPKQYPELRRSYVFRKNNIFNENRIDYLKQYNVNYAFRRNNPEYIINPLVLTGVKKTNKIMCFDTGCFWHINQGDKYY